MIAPVLKTLDLAILVDAPFVQRPSTPVTGKKANADRHGDFHPAPPEKHIIASRFKFRNLVHKHRQSHSPLHVHIRRFGNGNDFARLIKPPLTNVINFGQPA